MGATKYIRCDECERAVGRCECNEVGTPAAPVPASTVVRQVCEEYRGTRWGKAAEAIGDRIIARMGAPVAARELDVEAERSGEHPLWVEMQRLTRYRHSMSGMLAAPSGGFYSATDVQAMIAEFAARSAAQSTAPVSTEQAGDERHG